MSPFLERPALAKDLDGVERGDGVDNLELLLALQPARGFARPLKESESIKDNPTDHVNVVFLQRSPPQRW